MASTISLPIIQCVVWVEGGQAKHPFLRSPRPFVEIANGSPDLDYVDAMQRRRLSRLSRAVLHCAGRCRTEGQNFRIVMASRYGDTGRTMEILRDLAAGEDISPMAFGLSVHNATAAVFSIVKGHKSPISAMAAGEESFGWGLIEAYSAWKTSQGSPVLYLYGDDCLPDGLASFGDSGEQLHAVALWVGKPAVYTLRVGWEEAEATVVPSQPQSFHFLGRLLGANAPREWRGRRLAWSWDVIAGED